MLASAGGFGGSILFPAGTLKNGTALTSTTTNAAPHGVPAFAPQTERAQATGVAGAAIVYYGLDFSLSTGQNGAVDLSTTIPQSATVKKSNYWLALYDPTLKPAAWQYGIAGPSSVKTTSLNFTLAGGYPFAGAKTYWLAVYAVPKGTATPIPPPGKLQARPGTLQLQGTGSAHARSISIVEPGYSGYFQLSSSNASVATVAQNVVLGPTGSVSIVPAGGGTATITISDQNGNIKKISVGVTAGVVIINGAHQ